MTKGPKEIAKVGEAAEMISREAGRRILRQNWECSQMKSEEGNEENGWFERKLDAQ